VLEEAACSSTAGGFTTVKAGKSRSYSENIYLILTLQAKQQDWLSSMMYT
jgi:hypothetical protein